MLIIIVYIIAFWLLLPAALICSAIYLDTMVHLGFPDSAMLPACGIGITGISAIFLSTAIVQFRRFGRTLPISAKPPQVLINQGLFAVWRHPIYLFYIWLFIGIALIIQSANLLLIVLPAFAGGLYIYILIEEHFLLKRFCRAYTYYRKSTSLIIPKLPQLLRIPLWLLFKLMFNFKVINKEYTHLPSPFFLLSTHRNYLDPFFIGIPIDLPVNYVTTYEMFRKSWLAFIFRKLRCLPKKRFLSDGETTRQIIRILKQGGVIGIFPEGERSWTGETASLKPEVLKLLKKFHNFPILPVKINGNYHAWPRWGSRPRRSTVTVIYQKPLFIRGDEKIDQLEKQLFRILKPDDKQGFCKSKRMAPQLTKVLYRCPVCFGFDALVFNRRDQLRCSICQTVYTVQPDYAIRYIFSGSERKETIDEIYRKIKVNRRDINPGIHQNILKSQKFKMPDEPFLLAENHVSLYKFTENGALKLLDGHCWLSTRQLLFYNKETIFPIDLQSIRSVTVESNYKLQLYDYRQKQLYQILFVSHACLKWQDLITLTIGTYLNFQPNRQ